MHNISLIVYEQICRTQLFIYTYKEVLGKRSWSHFRVDYGKVRKKKKGQSSTEVDIYRVQLGGLGTVRF